MELMTAYMMMDDPEAVECCGGLTVEDFIEAARIMRANPEVLMTAPGRVGRNVEHMLDHYTDVEEDF